MNKTSKLFLGFASLAMLSACSSDEPKGEVTPPQRATVPRCIWLSTSQMPTPWAVHFLTVWKKVITLPVRAKRAK